MLETIDITQDKTFHRITHGTPVSCFIQGKCVADGKISIDGDANYFVCQDVVEGSGGPTLGYEHSYRFTTGVTESLKDSLDNSDVTKLKTIRQIGKRDIIAGTETNLIGEEMATVELMNLDVEEKLDVEKMDVELLQLELAREMAERSGQPLAPYNDAITGRNTLVKVESFAKVYSLMAIPCIALDDGSVVVGEKKVEARLGDRTTTRFKADLLKEYTELVPADISQKVIQFQQKFATSEFTVLTPEFTIKHTDPLMVMLLDGLSFIIGHWAEFYDLNT